MFNFVAARVVPRPSAGYGMDKVRRGMLVMGNHGAVRVEIEKEP